MQLRTIAPFLCIALTSILASIPVPAASPVDAQQAGALRITRAYARATVPQQSTGAAYLTIDNQGKAGDRLLGVSVGSNIAQEAELHFMAMRGDMMRMRPLAELALPPAQHLAMKPGDGAHIMLVGLKQRLKAGDQFPLTLRFEKAGKLNVMVKVEDISIQQK